MGGKTVVADRRVYERLPDGRTILAAVPGDVLNRERAEQLGLVGKHKPLEHPPVNQPLLDEGLHPLKGPEQDAKATGHTAEATARGAIERAPTSPVTLRETHEPKPRTATRDRRMRQHD